MKVKVVSPGTSPSPGSWTQMFSNHPSLCAHLSNMLSSSKQSMKCWDVFSRGYYEDRWDYICERSQQTSNERRCVPVESCFVWSPSLLDGVFSHLPQRPGTTSILLFPSLPIDPKEDKSQSIGQSCFPKMYESESYLYHLFQEQLFFSNRFNTHIEYIHGIFFFPKNWSQVLQGKHFICCDIIVYFHSALKRKVDWGAGG